RPRPLLYHSLFCFSYLCFSLTQNMCEIPDTFIDKGCSFSRQIDDVVLFRIKIEITEKIESRPVTHLRIVLELGEIHGCNAFLLIDSSDLKDLLGVTKPSVQDAELITDLCLDSFHYKTFAIFAVGRAITVTNSRSAVCGSDSNAFLLSDSVVSINIGAFCLDHSIAFVSSYSNFVLTETPSSLS